MKNILCFVDVETTGIKDNDYPIELAMIFCDPDTFEIYNRYTSLIKWDCVIQKSNKTEWHEDYQSAYKIHNIPFDYWLNNSYSTVCIVHEIKFICSELISRFGECKFIIVSDNPYFDLNMIKRIYDNVNQVHPFHYNPRSVSILFDLFNVEFKNFKHRAEIDVIDIFTKSKDIILKIKNKFELNEEYVCVSKCEENKS